MVHESVERGEAGAANPEFWNSSGGLRNYWYIGAPSIRLKNKPFATTVLGQDLVLFRDGDGVANALLDRCCHRGARLSLGQVNSGTLACRYHGWRYDGAGRCVEIPSLARGVKVKASFAIPSFPCAEQDGYVWVHLGQPDQARGPVPLIPSFAGQRWTQGTMNFACSWLAGIENNLDWCHASFTHPWTHPHYYEAKLRGLRNKPYEMRVTETGMVLFAPVTDSGDRPIPSDALRIRFDLPDRIVFTPSGEIPMIVLHFVPTGPSSCRLEYLARRPIPIGPKLVWSKKDSRVFAEDRLVLESAQTWYDKSSDDFERSVEADAAPLLARRIAALAGRSEWDEWRPKLVQRRVIDVRA